MSKWYIQEMKPILLSADGDIFVYNVPDVMADGLVGLVKDYYHWKRNKGYGAPVYLPAGEVVYVYDPIEEFIEFMGRKCPEHSPELVEILDCGGEIPAQYQRSHAWNF